MLKQSRGIFNVCLTGGPCGGKTSALDSMKLSLEKEGFDVYCIPEVPSILMIGGCKYPGNNGGDKLQVFEKNLLQLQLDMESSFRNIAESTGNKSVIIHDRGLMDVKTYLPNELWHDILQRNQWKETEFLNRYDLVIHLVTAADGAESFFTTANNAARKESPAQARDLDKRTQLSWEKHPKLVIVDNKVSNFAEKTQKAVTTVFDAIRSSFSS